MFLYKNQSATVLTLVYCKQLVEINHNLFFRTFYHEPQLLRCNDNLVIAEYISQTDISRVAIVNTESRDVTYNTDVITTSGRSVTVMDLLQYSRQSSEAPTISTTNNKLIDCTITVGRSRARGRHE